MPAATASHDHPFGGAPGVGGEHEAGHAEEDCRDRRRRARELASR